MTKILVICFLVIIINFLYLSISYGQSSVNISGYVPETEKNSSVLTEQSKSAINKENKYQYFFEKVWESKKNSQLKEKQSQTFYDKISSFGLLGVIMIFFGCAIWTLIRLIDKYLFSLFRRFKI